MLHEPPRHDTRAMLIAVDSYDHQVPAGELFYPAREERRSFVGLTQLLLQMDACMEAEDAPQAFQAERTFFPLVKPVPEEHIEKAWRIGKCSTFTIAVLYRRNSSWQGKLTWLETGETERFRSVLELVHLLNSAMTKQELIPLFQTDSEQILGKAE